MSGAERFPTLVLLSGTIAPLAAAWYQLSDPGAEGLLLVIVPCLTVAPVAVVLAIVRVFKTQSKIAVILLALSAAGNAALCTLMATTLFR